MSGRERAPARMGTEGLKAYLEPLFRQERLTEASLSFSWERDGRVGSLHRERSGAVQLRLDLGRLQGRRFASGQEQRAAARAALYAVAERLRFLRAAPALMPESYLEGVALLLDREAWEREGRLVAYLPALTGAEAVPGAMGGPGDLRCAMAALERLRAELQGEHTRDLDAVLEELALWAPLPELIWGRDCPRFSLQAALSAAEGLRARGDEIRALKMLEGEDGALCSLPRLLERCSGAEPPFPTGIALRLLCRTALADLDVPGPIPEGSARRLQADIAAFALQTRSRGDGPCRDELLAIGELARGLDRLLSGEATSGAYHPMGPPPRRARRG